MFLYEGIRESSALPFFKMTLENKVKKHIEGEVRLTLYKYIRVGEYVMALLSPQWNMPTGSNMDYDTLSPAITNNITVKNEGDYYTTSPAY